MIIPLTLFLSFMLQFSLGFLSSHSKVLDNPPVFSLESLCISTLYPTTCYHTLSKSPLINTKQNYNLTFFYNQSVHVSIGEVRRVSKSFQEDGPLSRKIKDTNKKIWQSALESCRDSLSLALYNLNRCLPNDDNNVVASQEAHSNITSWLGAARTHLQTCTDGFEDAHSDIRKVVVAILDNPTKLVTTNLAIVSKIDDLMSPDDKEKEPRVDRVDTSGELAKYDWESIWTSSKAKKRPSPNPGRQSGAVNADAVVAKDGSGKYTTITKALDAVPPRSNKRFVIHVKKGVYNENVFVKKEKWNILMYGDGMQNTIISSNRANRTGSSTASSATFSVYGMGFIAKDMGFRNTAGAIGGQAVALLSASDRSVFYRCLIDGYQDTLYAQSQKQFYRECKIYGTMDFIFGDAAIVIQNSDIYVRRRSSSGGATIITAQGKGGPNSKTGISIQNCSIQAAENLGGFPAFLGRPWQSYSTVVVMESQLGSLIDPKGWSAWGGKPPPSTIDYVEYNNKGPGAVTTRRVPWKGVKVKNTQGDASKFTVNSFIDGAKWLPSIGVPFQGGL